MKLPDALRGITLLAIDSAPFIYFVEKNPNYFDSMVLVLRYITSGPISAVSSTLTLTEVLTQPLQKNNSALVNEYEDILQNSIGFELLPVSAAIARRAADLRARYNLKTPDALHLATALEAHADAFLTNDLELKRVRELRILVLDELETDPPSGETT